MPKRKGLSGAVEGWLDQAGSKETRRSYLRAVTDFLGVVGERLTSENATAYMRMLRGRDLSRSTEAHHISAVRSFLRYCMDDGVIERTPDHIIRHRRSTEAEIEALDIEPARKALTPDETARLIAAARTLSPVHYATVLGFLGTGLRVSEMARGKWKNLRAVDSNFELRTIRKRGKRDAVPVLPEAVAAWATLRGGMPETWDRDDTPLIHHARARLPYTARRIRDFVYEAADAAGLDRSDVHPHTLRHTVGSGMARAGASVWDIQVQLGHSDPATSAGYVHDTRELPQRVAVLRQLSWAI